MPEAGLLSLSAIWAWGHNIHRSRGITKSNRKAPHPLRSRKAETVGAMPLQDGCRAGEGSAEKVQDLKASMKEMDLAVGGGAHCCG